MISHEPHLEYSPINYELFPPNQWGDGASILSDLNPELARFWRDALPLQDQRGDKGHAEIVTWFALRLSALENLAQSEREVAVAAAIGHDIGWSQIEGINERFADIMHARFATDKSVQAKAKIEERALRVAHQEEGARITRDLLGQDFPGLDEVCSIILDHDTREGSPWRSAKVVWDADILWRVTVIGREAGLRQTGLSPDAWGEVALGELQLSQRKLQTRIALQIGTREYQNTVEYCSRQVANF